VSDLTTESVPGSPPRKVWLEVLGLYLGTLVLIRVVVEAQRGLGLPDLVLALVPILFMYTPVWSCRWRGADPWAYPMALPSFGDRQPWLEALRWLAVLAILIFVPFVIGYHLWQTIGLPAIQPVVYDLFRLRLFTHPPELQWIWPSNPLKLVAYNLFFVAIPEEMFYRGYLQTRLNEILPRRWVVFGTPIGPGLLWTCLLFAFGHSLVNPQWWHVFIFVPSLAFGWLRERTDGIVAGAFFHAWCNVTVTTLDTLYGIVPPSP
jgi:uncharacterized protein